MPGYCSGIGVHRQIHGAQSGALSMVLHCFAQSAHMKFPPNIQYSIVSANRGTEHPVRTTMHRVCTVM